MTPSKPKKGQELYKVVTRRTYKHMSDGYEYETKSEPVTVVKVGREYFYTAREGWESEEYKNMWYRDSFESYNSGRINLYESWDHYFETKERERLRELITNNLPAYGSIAYSYQQLRAVADILEIQ